MCRVLANEMLRKTDLHVTGLIDEKKMRENINERKFLVGTIVCIHSWKPWRFQVRGLCKQSSTIPWISNWPYLEIVYQSGKTNRVPSLLPVFKYIDVFIANFIIYQMLSSSRTEKIFYLQQPQHKNVTQILNLFKAIYDSSLELNQFKSTNKRVNNQNHQSHLIHWSLWFMLQSNPSHCWQAFPNRAVDRAAE